MTDEEKPEIEVEAQEQLTEVEAQVAESSTASEDKHEQKSNGFQERINKVTAQKYDALKKAEEAERRARELEEKLIQQKKAEAPSDMPDQDLMYENPEEYKAQLAAYHANLAKQTLEEQQRQLQEQQAMQAQREAQSQAEKAFIESAASNGIDAEKAFQSAQVLIDRGMNGVLGQLISESSEQAALVHYLAQNPHDFEQLNSSNSFTATMRKLDDVASRAIAKKVSSAPEPIPEVKGATVKEVEDDPMFKNAQFR